MSSFLQIGNLDCPRKVLISNLDEKRSIVDKNLESLQKLRALALLPPIKKKKTTMKTDDIVN